MKKEWRDVVGYERKYLISNYGDLARVHKYTPVSSKKPSTDEDGYLRVRLHDKNFTKYIGIHKLVAQAFIPNPENKPQVNHINGDKTDNRVNNLEWVTASENNYHKFMVLDPKSYHKRRKAVKCEELDRVFESITAASKELNIHRGDIRDVANNKPQHITAGGYHWSWYLSGEVKLDEVDINKLLKSKEK